MPIFFRSPAKKPGLFCLSKKSIISSCLLLALSGGVNATTLYDSGSLSFSTTDQSMWATGDAFVEQNSVFLGAEWTDKTATFGGILGSEDAIITPAVPSVQITPRIPAVVVAGVEITPAIPAVYSPYIPAITGDTRTGAQLDVHSSGKVGLEFGYTINSGSVDADVEFSALAELPDRVDQGEVVDINTSSTLDGGSITTQSPELEAYISSIMKLSGSVDAKACFIAAGCTSGSAGLPTIDMDQRIVSIDPNSIKILDGILPGDEPLAEIALANQSITLSGGATTTAPPVPVFELSSSTGLEVSSVPGVPAITVDLAEIEVQVPNIATSGDMDGSGKIKSAGRDDVLGLQLDIDGLATVSGLLPPAGVTLDVVVAEVHIDLIDVDMGPTLGVTQDFELIPTLMATLEFSNSILIDGMAGLQDSWTGAWADLPYFSLSETTVFSPTYWVDVILENDFGLDLGLSGTLDVLKLEAGFAGGLLSVGPVSLNGLLGLGNTLFETDKIGFSVSKEQFRLSGFNRIDGKDFTINVPEPGILWLIALGMISMIFSRRHRRQLTFIEA